MCNPQKTERPGALLSNDALFTTAELSTYLRRPTGTLRQWRHRGYGPRGFLLGGTVVYRRSVVDAWLVGQEQAVTREVAGE